MGNPYLAPPQVESPKSRSWGYGFAYGFQGPTQSSMTPDDIQPEDADAFDEGVLAGQDAAIHGVPLDNSCIDLHAEGPTLAHLALEGPELVTWAADCYEGLAGGIAGGVLFVINLSIALETFTDDPETRLSEAASALQAQIQKMGFDGSVELFIGSGLDKSVEGCELKLTSVFRTQDDATTAAKALGRPHWLVASWRTDQSGGAKIADFSN